MCLIIIFFGVSVLITGCGEEDITEPEAEMVEPEDPCMQKGPPKAIAPFHVTPPAGGIISSSQEFMLTFDIVVVEVTVNGILATATEADGIGRVSVVSLILEPGPRSLAVEWTEPDGCTGTEAVGPYTVVADED